MLKNPEQVFLYDNSRIFDVNSAAEGVINAGFKPVTFKNPNVAYAHLNSHSVFALIAFNAISKNSPASRLTRLFSRKPADQTVISRERNFDNLANKAMKLDIPYLLLQTSATFSVVAHKGETAVFENHGYEPDSPQLDKEVQAWLGSLVLPQNLQDAPDLKLAGGQA